MSPPLEALPRCPSFASLFDDPGQWQVFASGQSEGKLSQIPGPDGQPGIRFEYNFHGGGGFVVMRRVSPLVMPGTFEIGFAVRGSGPPNNFELKVAAPGGADVWRHLRPDCQLPADWGNYRFTERELPFAWGPAGGGPPSDVEAVEFVIAAGPGGKGVLELSSVYLEDQTLRHPRSIQASSSHPTHPSTDAFDDRPLTEWKAAANDPKPWWMMDFGRNLRFGGVVLDWPEKLPARSYQLDVSNDGESWTRLYQATSTLGPRSHIPTHGAEARYLKLSFDHPECAALRHFSLRSDAFSRTPNEFIHAVAVDFPRGWAPRYWLREQSYWTPIGTPDGGHRALINEEGLVELDEGSFSLEPFVSLSDGLVTWADVEITLSLEDKGAPLPRVKWKHPSGLTLEILPWVDGNDESLALHVTYRLHYPKNDHGACFVVAARPFQVNPPWQAFRNLGGRSPIHRIATDSADIRVNDRHLLASPTPDSSAGVLFEEGGILRFLTEGTLPLRQRVEYESGLASATMAWEFPPGESTMEVTVTAPYHGRPREPAANARALALDHWKKTLASPRWNTPASAAPAFDCFHTAAAHILINSDGPALQPGPRRYSRSWVRDCVIMGAALTKAGIAEPLHEFLSWYAGFQREDGFVPCVVDRDGVDWLVEHDSHGQFLWGVREVIRHREDHEFLQQMMPHVALAANYLITLRHQPPSECLTPEECFAFEGILPVSASHEGYLAHPVHSYWDDFWGVRGLEAAAELATAVGRKEDARRWNDEATAFHDSLLDSLNKVIDKHQLAYIPGSVEWADFDPTATANAIGMLDFADALPAGPLRAMLDTYLDGFRKKHRGEIPWNNYTAYEIRIIGAFVRLGDRDSANELLKFFLSDRRPVEWNQWPEITWRDPRSPGHLGDVPHTWIAAEYILALASMVASEREATDSMVLAAGMPWEWIAEENGFSVSSLPTRHGLLDFSIRASAKNIIHLEIGGDLILPPGGLSVAPPLLPGARIHSVRCEAGDMPTVAISGEFIVVTSLPCTVELILGPLKQLA